LEESSQESLFVHKDEFKDAFDEVRMAMEILKRDQEETSRNQMEQSGKILAMMESVRFSIDNKLETLGREVTKNIEDKLTVDLRVIGQSINSLQSRVHNMEVIGGYTAERSPIQDSPNIPLDGVSFRDRALPIDLSFQREPASARLTEPTMHDHRRGSIIGSVQSDDILMRESGQRKLIVSSDKHLEIKWKDQTLDGFIKFLTQINLFQKSRQQSVPCLFTHFSEDIQNEVERLLLTHKSATYRDRSQVPWASLEDICQVLLHMFVPHDLSTFNELLLQSCRPYRVQRTQGDLKKDFKKTRSLIYTLREAFKERYKFLLDAAKATGNIRSIPACSFKEGGLFHTWLLLTPTGMRQSFQQDLERHRYESLEKFFEAYFEYLDETHEMMEKARMVESRVKDIPESRDNAFQRHRESSNSSRFSDGYDSRSYNPNRRQYESRDIRSDGAYHRQSNNLRLMQDVEHYHGDIEVDNLSEDYDDELLATYEDTRFNGKYNVNESKLHKRETPSDNYQKTKFSDSNYQRKEEPISRNNDHWSSKGESQESARASNFLCQKLVMHNKCTDTACRFVHTPYQLIREERERIMQQLQRWQGPSISRGIRPPPGRHPEMPSVNIVKGVDKELEVEEDENDGQLNQIEALMRISETAQYWKAAHKRATVCLDNSELVATGVITLFDTGASSGNYVSRAFVDKHSLSDRLIPVNKKIKVANGSKVEIRERIMLRVNFESNSGQRSAVLEFDVINGMSLDLIIGLPSICNHFKELLAEMMGNVLFHEDDCNADLNSIDYIDTKILTTV
jgi:hypothetical protein